MNKLSSNLELFLEQQYCVSLSRNQVSSYPFVFSDLLNESKQDQILTNHATELDHPPLAIVGSLFAKRFSVYCMAALSSVSLFDKQLPVSPDKIHFSIIQQAQMVYQIDRHDIVSVDYSTSSNRKKSVNRYINQLYELLTTIIKSVSSYTGIHPNTMWSLISHNLHNLYLRLKERCVDTVFDKRLPYILEDRALLNEQNPDNFTYYCHPEQTEQYFYLRKHCCLAFKLNSNHGYCLTCPRISNSVRDATITKKTQR
ncbi:(2Fe-2S)-binding protein [Alkalicoccobacillus murimartini]|uniref:Ferric iron reductase protein FhuF n=1 Tax=Alkalicoccobacillus murimartini TaxID=171685 RepID=A0ABT9YLH5_9BACI|nr:(2Fe-2S)-binding protein [Alkalicoccobacillus murimartini]MDQ0208732.1 ferric iron reductase protein FhuF [Alkalicoccobacillus murimartini]